MLIPSEGIVLARYTNALKAIEGIEPSWYSFAGRHIAILSYCQLRWEMPEFASGLEVLETPVLLLHHTPTKLGRRDLNPH